MTVKRGFVDIDEGQVHYRHKGAEEDVPLVMMHPGPTSSHAIVPLIERLGEKRRVLAPDLLGMGDSAAPAHEKADMSYFADAALRTVDALGIETFDLWGSMTGAHCAIEMAIDDGESTMSAIATGCGASGGCGSCRADVEKILLRKLGRVDPVTPKRADDTDAGDSQLSLFGDGT